MRHGVLGVQLLLFLWSSLRGSSFVSRSSYFHAARETKLQTSYRASTVLKSSPDVSSSAAEWEDLGGNFVLRPPNDVPVRAVVHFLGGAFVGAAPHVTYRYLLYGLARQGLPCRHDAVPTRFRLFGGLRLHTRVLRVPQSHSPSSMVRCRWSAWDTRAARFSRCTSLASSPTRRRSQHPHFVQ